MARGVRKSLVGQRFGKLVVESYNGTDKFRNSTWLCKCDCGNTIVVKGTLLTKGYGGTTNKIVSCGICSNKLEDTPTKTKETIDTSMIGQRYGKLVVDEVFMKLVNKEKGHSQMYAKCTCDCGNKKEVLTTTLKNGTTLSCGCLKMEKLRKTKFLLSDDFIGERFGLLTVVGYDDTKKRWKCQCDCGNIKYLFKTNLTKNGYRSCGNCYGKKSKNRRTRKELENGN